MFGRTRAVDDADGMRTKFDLEFDAVLHRICKGAAFSKDDLIVKGVD